MNRNGRVGHDRFRPGGRDFEKSAGLLHNFISDIVKISLLRRGYDFLVGKRGLSHRVPVDHAAAAIDQPLFVKIDKNVQDTADVSLIERIALP